MLENNLTIIDGDSLMYTSSYKVSSAEEALQKCKRSIYEVLYATKADYYVGYLTNSSHKYSLAITKAYKGNRKDFVKPKYFSLIKEYLMDEFNFITQPNTEADDLCISAYKLALKEAYYPTISATDKDLLQIEGNFYNPRTKVFKSLTADEAAYNLFTQMLTGDTADNIEGLPGIGPVKATKILNEGKSFNDYFNAVISSYMDYYSKDVFTGLSKFSENYQLLFLDRDKLENLEVFKVNKEDISNILYNNSEDGSRERGVEADGQEEIKTPSF